MKKPEDALVKAASPVYIVLCKDGIPHNDALPVMLEFTSAKTLEQAVDVDASLKCGPHRVQAYGPML